MVINVLLQDVPLPSPASSVSTVSSLLQSPVMQPMIINVTNETEVNLAQSSDNTSSPITPVVTLSKCKLLACYILFCYTAVGTVHVTMYSVVSLS